MDRKETVNKFLERGLLLAPQVLERITEENIDDYLKIKTERPVITLDVLEGKGDVSIDAIRFTKKKKLSVKDFVKYYNNRYESIKPLLLKKVDAVSINKVQNIHKEASIIGIVKEPSASGFFLEDQTGVIEVISRHFPQPDDVLAVSGHFKEGRFFENEIIFPDVPLPKAIQSINTTLHFNGTSLLVEGREAAITTNPSWFKIRKGEGIVIVVVYAPHKEIPKEEAVLLLKKRYLPRASRTDVFSGGDPLLLDPIPSIILLNQPQQWSTNYKGTTVISGAGVEIDLETREVKFQQAA